MVLLFCFAVPYLLVAVPGKFVTVTPKYLLYKPATTHDVALHGWPAVHCIANHEPASTTAATVLDRRKLSDSVLFGPEGKLSADNIHSIIWANDNITNLLATDIEFRGPYVETSYQHTNFWTNTSGYMYFSPEVWPRWSVPGLLINLLCFALYLSAIATFFEFLRRRKSHFYQITILDSLIGIAVVALLIALCNNQYRRANSIRESLELVRTNGAKLGKFHVSSYFPAWLERLTDSRFDKQVRDNWAGASASDILPSRFPFGTSEIQTIIYNITDSKSVVDFAKQAKTITEIGLSASKTKTLYEIVESLNPSYLQKIEIDHRKEFDVSRLANKHALKVMDLRQFELQFSELKEPGFAQVTWLRFWGTDPNQRISDLIHSMPKLKTFFCKPGILNSIDTLPDQLKTLSVYFDGDFELVDSEAKLSKLTRIDLFLWFTNAPKYKLPREIGIDLTKLPNLRCLCLSRISLDDLTIERLTKMPNLECLILHHHKSDIPDDKLKQLIPEIVFAF